MLVVGVVLVIVVVWCATTLGEIEIEGECFRVKGCLHRGKGIIHRGGGRKGSYIGGRESYI